LLPIVFAVMQKKLSYDFECVKPLEATMFR